VYKNINRLKGDGIIKKYFYLQRNYDLKKGQRTIRDLNQILKDFGVNFNVVEENISKKLLIEIDEEKLKSVKEKKENNAKVGRPVEHRIDFKAVERMQAEGMTNKQIYEKLDVSKALFYKRLAEYKNNNGHKKEKKMEYKEGRLSYNHKTKRYSFLLSDLWEKDFHCGNHLQVLLDGEWVPTRIEMDIHEKWYLVGVNKTGRELEGLRVRIETE
jgi:hypothetical protein